MHSNLYLKELNNCVLEKNYEKAEYLIYHLLESSQYSILLKSDIMKINYLMHLKNAKSIVYKLLLKNKKSAFLRLLLIDLFIVEKNYSKAIKWSQKSILLADINVKYEIFHRLAFLFYLVNRPERAKLFLNLCNRLLQNQK